MLELVAFIKGFVALKQVVDRFVAEWINHDIRKIGGNAQAQIQEMEVINAKLEVANTDAERRTLLRILNRIPR